MGELLIKMPKKFTLVDKHPDKDKIIKALIKGISYQEISRQFGISKAALGQYLNDKLIKSVATAKAQEVQRDGKLADSEIQRIMSKVEKLFNACDKWLRDPENEDEYTVDLRSSEINVVYTRYVDDKPVQDRDDLQCIIDQYFKKDNDLKIIHTKMADIRQLIINTANSLAKLLELKAKIQGAIPDIKIDITISEAWLVVKQSIIDATKEYPEVRERILNGIRKSNIEK